MSRQWPSSQKAWIVPDLFGSIRILSDFAVGSTLELPARPVFAREELGRIRGVRELHPLRVVIQLASLTRAERRDTEKHRFVERRGILEGRARRRLPLAGTHPVRSEEHTSELQSQSNLVCR